MKNFGLQIHKTSPTIYNKMYYYNKVIFEIDTYHFVPFIPTSKFEQKNDTR